MPSAHSSDVNLQSWSDALSAQRETLRTGCAAIQQLKRFTGAETHQKNQQTLLTQQWPTGLHNGIVTDSRLVNNLKVLHQAFQTSDLTADKD